MTNNFKFCNDDFLNLYCYKPAPFYNQFYLEDATKSLIDSMGEHPNFHLVFKYNPEKRIRATFIVFDEEGLQEMDVKCICVLFHGDRRDNYCFFYEMYEDQTIGCVQVAHQYNSDRIVLEMNVGTTGAFNLFGDGIRTEFYRGVATVANDKEFLQDLMAHITIADGKAREISKLYDECKNKLDNPILP